MLKIDIDACKVHPALVELKLLELHYRFGCKLKKTKHGIHIYVPSLPDSEPLRRMYLDDPDRVEADSKRRIKNLLFDVKVSRNGLRVSEEVSLEEAVEHVRRLWRCRRGN